MINATVPALPSYDDMATVEIDGTIVFSRPAYEWQFKMTSFLNALQAEPLTMLQVGLERFATRLGRAQTGLIVFVRDYNHQLMWTGSGWSYGPGDSGSGWYADFDPASVPSGVGWALCDSSTVNALQADGSLVPVTLPTTANRYFRI